MAKVVSFAAVNSYLEENGYQLARRRKYPDARNVWYVVFTRPGSPAIAFPTGNKKVLTRHFERMKLIIGKLHDQDEKDN